MGPAPARGGRVERGSLLWLCAAPQRSAACSLARPARAPLGETCAVQTSVLSPPSCVVSVTWGPRDSTAPLPFCHPISWLTIRAVSPYSKTTASPLPILFKIRSTRPTVVKADACVRALTARVSTEHTETGSRGRASRDRHTVHLRLAFAPKRTRSEVICNPRF